MISKLRFSEANQPLTGFPLSGAEALRKLRSVHTINSLQNYFLPEYPRMLENFANFLSDQAGKGYEYTDDSVIQAGMNIFSANPQNRRMDQKLFSF